MTDNSKRDLQIAIDFLELLSRDDPEGWIEWDTLGSALLDDPVLTAGVCACIVQETADEVQAVEAIDSLGDCIRDANKRFVRPMSLNGL